MALTGKVRVAMCQMAVGACKTTNIAAAATMVRDAKARNADVVVLPECYNCPYGTKYFAEYAEAVPQLGDDATAATGETVRAAAAAAREHGVWLVAGSVPERDGEQLFNTSMVIDPQGVLRGRHRKMHLFKLDTEQVKFDESEVLTAGNAPTVVDVATPAVSLRVGLGICFDIRFPQLAATYQAQGTSLLVYPGAFNMVTGPAHWTLAARSRAVDAQQYVCVVSPARDTGADYVAYGHSLLVDPWGEVVAEAGEGPELVVAEMDLAAVATTRQRLPTMAGIRHDLYDVAWK